VEVSFPDVAVTVTEVVPTAVELPAINVNVAVCTVKFDVMETEFGDTEALTPLGKPETEMLTLPLKPFWPEMLRFVVVELPCPRPTLCGPEIAIAGGDTVKENVTLDVIFPDVPVMVMTFVPTGVEPLAERVKYTNGLDVLARLTGFGEKLAVTPVGSPEMARLTGPENPFMGLIGTKTDVVAPCPKATLPGLRTLKLEAAIASGNEAVDVSFPDVPVMVTILVPMGAVPVAESVKEEFPVAGFGEMLAVTPLGRPDTDRLTGPRKP